MSKTIKTLENINKAVQERIEKDFLELRENTFQHNLQKKINRIVN